MTCKYPITSRSYKFCIDCSDIGCCEDAVTFNTPMPEVQPPKNVIPSALEANKMTNHVIFGDTQLEDIGKEIRESIEKGKFYIHGEGYLKSEVRKKLNELGYGIQTGSQYNEPYYTVSWEEVE